MKFIISLCGCDDESVVIMDVSAEELEFLQNLKEKIDEVSTYSCMPILLLQEVKENESED